MSRERLRATFDHAAARYQDDRPDYPEQLFADLLALTGVAPPAHLLEVGCGPGKDLVYAATAWHWVDPEVKYAKAAGLLAPRGHLAVWSAGHAFPGGRITRHWSATLTLGRRH